MIVAPARQPARDGLSAGTAHFAGVSGSAVRRQCRPAERLDRLDDNSRRPRPRRTIRTTRSAMQNESALAPDEGGQAGVCRGGVLELRRGAAADPRAGRHPVLSRCSPTARRRSASSRTDVDKLIATLQAAQHPRGRMDSDPQRVERRGRLRHEDAGGGARRDRGHRAQHARPDPVRAELQGRRRAGRRFAAFSGKARASSRPISS